jgi:hypothetical protein
VARVQTTLDLQRVRREAREQIESMSAQFETLLNQSPRGFISSTTIFEYGS